MSSKFKELLDKASLLSLSKFIDSDFITFEENLSISEVRKKLKGIWDRRRTGSSLYLYVTRNNVLSGVLSLESLSIADDQNLVSDVCLKTRINSISNTDSLEIAIEKLIISGLRALPVINDLGELVGVIREEVLSGNSNQSLTRVLLEDEVHELSADVNTLENEINALTPFEPDALKNASPITSIGLRTLPLLGTIISGGACALALQLDTKIKVALPLALIFIPLLLQLGDAVCHQASCIAITRFSNKVVDLGSFLQVFAWELIVYIATAVSATICIGTLAYIFSQNHILGLGIGLSAGAIVFSGGLIGFLVPIVIKHLKGNPDSSTGPISLGITDFVSTVLFLVTLGVILG
ncbi:MAG TPA: magnesium transporter [Oligoflexia bacterium]|nr:magnesium transporter [Oligoflexia bacterium]HMP48382.1 magnesium transporter [Oligoflexia bacterium]